MEYLVTTLALLIVFLILVAYGPRRRSRSGGRHRGGRGGGIL